MSEDKALPLGQLHADTCAVPKAHFADDNRCTCGLRERVDDAFAAHEAASAHKAEVVCVVCGLTENATGEILGRDLKHFSCWNHEQHGGRSAHKAEEPTPTLGVPEWLIKFDDPDRSDELFTDEITARLALAQHLQQWSCYLFQLVAPEPADKAGAILGPTYCARTLHLVGTDTWMTGSMCDCIECVRYMAHRHGILRAAEAAARAEEFERLYGKIVERISADIAGDFDAGLDQLVYNVGAEERAACAEMLEDEAAEIQQCADTYDPGDPGNPRRHLGTEAGHYRKATQRVRARGASQ